MFLSFDIGGTSIKYGVVSDTGEIILNESCPTINDKEKVISILFEIIEKTKKTYSIEGIGISAPGIIKKDGTLVTAGAITSLYGENLKKIIEEKTKIPVTVDNDANAVAIAEKWLGNAKDFSNYICIVLGTGVGGGIVINNQVYSGTHGMAGEFGWNLIEKIPLHGLLETVSLNNKIATVGGLCNKYNELKIKKNREFTPILDARQIFTQEKNGDEIAQKVLDEFFNDLSIAILNLVSIFDPEAVLIGGGISGNDIFKERIEESYTNLKSRHNSLNNIKEKINPPIIMAKLKNNAGIIGATYQIKEAIRMG